MLIPAMQKWCDEQGLDPVAPLPTNKVSGYAATPGTGPKGMTCRECRHVRRTSMSRTYIKCGVIRHRWTHGPGTDIRLKSPACRFFEPSAEKK